MKNKHDESEQKEKRSDRWFLLLILLLFLLGLGFRSYGYWVTNSSKRAETSPSSNVTRKSFQAGNQTRSLSSQTGSSSDEMDWARLIAPYLTEGGLSFFLGFCLGFFLRLVAKTAMLVIGAVYFALILLSHYGMVTVDWGGIQEVVRHLLMNTQTQIEGLRGILTVSLPSIAMGSLGIWRGLKKS